MISFARSQTNCMAATMPASLTVTIRSTRSWMIGKVSSPSPVSRPSAMVCGSSEGRIRPAARDRKASSACSGSAPITRMPGQSSRAAMAVPLSSPPPPTGARITSRSGTSSSSSRAAVPWPAMTR